MDYFLKTQANTTFSDAIIPKPDPSAAGWNKVYFGKFNKKPLKWRVVAKRSTAFSKNKDKEALFLDCDEVLTEERFSYTGLDLHNWYRSHLWLYLNGEFASDNLSEMERSAVMLSYAFNDADDEAHSGDYHDHFSDDKFFAPTPSELQVSETRDRKSILASLLQTGQHFIRGNNEASQHFKRHHMRSGLF